VKTRGDGVRNLWRDAPVPGPTEEPADSCTCLGRGVIEQLKASLRDEPSSLIQAPSPNGHGFSRVGREATMIQLGGQ
jgi:hypothetical protein